MSFFLIGCSFPLILYYIYEIANNLSYEKEYKKSIAGESCVRLAPFSPKTCDEWEFSQWLLCASPEDLLKFGGYADSCFHFQHLFRGKSPYKDNVEQFIRKK
jgi:hypothetical protein